MGFIWQRSSIAVAAVIVLGAGAMALVRPHPISEPVLGAAWQCSRAAFVVTCNHRSDGVMIPVPSKPSWFAINDEVLVQTASD